MDYCNKFQSFINYALTHPRNISGRGIRCSCKRCKNKKFINLDVVTIHLLQKRFMKKYLCWYANEGPYVLHYTLVERMVESTSSSNNMHGVIDDNSNLYKSIVMDAMRMNQCYVGQCPIIDEEPNVNTATFFNLLKDYDELL